MNVAIVKYNAGNIYSVVNALRRMGIEPLLTDDAEQLQKADRVLFPGQGHAAETMEYLKARRLDEVIRDLKQPVFGICVGQQLLCKHSEEGDADCIGIFDPAREARGQGALYGLAKSQQSQVTIDGRTGRESLRLFCA